jgi:hypothetical protein
MDGQGKGIKEIGYIDCPGGGQIVVVDGIAYIGYIKECDGTGIVEVSDPRNPKTLSRITVPAGIHSHKVRVENGLMLVNREVLDPARAPKELKKGLAIFDISNPSKPKEIAFWETQGKGVHRFDFDGRYAYISPTVEGYVGNIVMILDLHDPARPTEIGRWWMPGQWIAGGEKPCWEGTHHRCHHPLRMGNRLYVSYCHGGFVILDIENMASPRFVSGLDWSPPFKSPTHTVLPVPFDLRGHKVVLVTDEDVTPLGPQAPSFLWLVEISDETRPVPFASFQLSEIDGSPQPSFTGCHQPVEKVRGNEIPVAWFAYGLRVVDISNPHSPCEVASYVPPVPNGESRVQSNDVYVDDRGLIYLLDRKRGVHILERA